jgi:hypothetical protein
MSRVDWKTVAMMVGFGAAAGTLFGVLSGAVATTEVDKNDNATKDRYIAKGAWIGAVVGTGIAVIATGIKLYKQPPAPPESVTLS